MDRRHHNLRNIAGTGLTLLAAALAASVAAAQTPPTRLPPLDTVDGAAIGTATGDEVIQAAHMADSDLLGAGARDVPPAAQPAAPPPAERGLLQWVGITATWLPAGGGDDFGETDIETKVVLALPCPTKESPLVITPGYAEHYLDGPTTADLPGRLIDSYVEFRWLPHITPRLLADLRVMPGWYSDAITSSSDAWRFGARAVGVYTSSPAWQWVAGGAFLDREDVPFMPIGGVIWTPNPATRWEAVFPQPKLAWRLDGGGSVETWGYVAGEFGGGQWAIQRADGSDDIATLRDLRVMLGLERKCCGGPSLRTEVGYVFGRSVEYASTTPDLEPGGTLEVRAELGY